MPCPVESLRDVAAPAVMDWRCGARVLPRSSCAARCLDFFRIPVCADEDVSSEKQADGWGIDGQARRRVNTREEDGGCDSEAGENGR